MGRRRVGSPRGLSLFQSRAPQTIVLNISSEARTKEFLRKPMEEQSRRLLFVLGCWPMYRRIDADLSLQALFMQGASGNIPRAGRGGAAHRGEAGGGGEAQRGWGGAGRDGMAAGRCAQDGGKSMRPERKNPSILPPRARQIIVLGVFFGGTNKRNPIQTGSRNTTNS